MSVSIRFEAMFLAALPHLWRHPSSLETTVPDCQLMPSMNSLLSFPRQNSAVGTTYSIRSCLQLLIAAILVPMLVLVRSPPGTMAVPAVASSRPSGS